MYEIYLLMALTVGTFVGVFIGHLIVQKIKNRRNFLFERLAEIEHERWADWQRYFHSKLEIAEDGTIVVPKDVYERAERQIETDYEDLSEEEKDSDREQVMRYWHLID